MQIVRDHVCIAGIMVQGRQPAVSIGVCLIPGMPLDQPEFRLFVSLSSRKMKSYSHPTSMPHGQAVLHISLHFEAHVVLP